MSNLPATACLDWPERMKSCGLPMNYDALPMYTAKAEQVAAALGNLRMPDIDGTPYMRDLDGAQWTFDLGRALWGGRDINEALLCMPKKQGKSSNGALLFSAAAIVDPLPSQKYTIISPSIDISEITYQIIRDSFSLDPHLKSLWHNKDHNKILINRETRTEIRVKAATPAALTGLKGNVLIDELWLLGKVSWGEKLRAQIRGALMASKHAKILSITTTSDEMPAGVFRQMLSMAYKVRDGEMRNKKFLPIIVEPWEGCDPWTDESVWPCILPSFPNICDPEEYRNIISEANSSGPGAVQRDKAQFFNITPKGNLHGEPWVVAEFWPLLSEPVSLADIIRDCESISIGIDLGGLDDLSAITVVGKTGGTEENTNYKVWSQAYFTNIAFELTSNDRSRGRFSDLIKEGSLTLCEPGGDIPAMIEICEQVRKSGKLHLVGIDPQSADDLASGLEAAGYDVSGNENSDVMGVGQTAFKLNSSVDTIERAATELRIAVDDSQLLSWAVGNALIEQSGSARRIQKSERHLKIDPIAGMLNAVSCFVMRKPRNFDASLLVA